MATTVGERSIVSSHARKDAAPATAEERCQPSYVSGASTRPLLGESIGAIFDRTIERFGDREALVSRHQGLRYSYAELAAAVEEVARGLLAMGLEPGERVGIWAPNCAEWTLVQFATAKLGIILVNINPAYRTSELEFALRQSGCRALVAARAFKSSDYVAMVEEVRPKVPTLEQVVFIDGPDWDALLAGAARVSAAEVAERQAATQFDDPINLQYTSGTTGFPKAATLSHHNILNNAYFVGRGCGYQRGGPDLHPRALLPLLRHGHGQLGGDRARRLHGHPGSRLRRGRGARDRAGGALHVALRRADDVHRRARHERFAEFELSSLRTGIMAGSPCPMTRCGASCRTCTCRRSRSATG